MRRRKIRLLVLGVTTLIVLSIGGMMVSLPSSRLVQLQDGSVWEMHMTSGTNHVRWIGRSRDFWLRLLPRPLAEKQAGRKLYLVTHTQTPTIIIWSRFTVRKSERLILALNSQDRTYRLTELSTQPGETAQSISSWPRSARSFRLEWFTANEPYSKVGSIEVKNPLRTEAPETTEVASEALIGELRIVPSVSVPRSTPSLPNFALAVLEGNVRSESYTIRGLWAEDAFGNRAFIKTDDENWSGTIGTVRGPLFAPELGWTLSGELIQVANFSSNQLVVFTNAPLPELTRAEDEAVTVLGSDRIGLRSINGSKGRYSQPGLLLTTTSKTPILPQIVSIETRERMINDYGLPDNYGANEAFYQGSMEATNGNVIVALGAVHSFKVKLKPRIEVD